MKICLRIVIIQTTLLLFLAGLARVEAQTPPAVAPEGQAEQQSADNTAADEDAVAALQSFDSFTSLEDGQPGDPGSLEVAVPVSWYNSGDVARSLAMEPEIAYTLDGGSEFLRSMTLFAAFEVEHSVEKNEDAFNFADFSTMQMGRATVNSAATFSPTDALLNYQLSRGYVNHFYPEELRSFGYYQTGRNLAGSSNISGVSLSDSTAALLTAPFPVASTADLLNYQLTRVFTGAQKFDDVRASNRIDLDQHASETESTFNFGWSQRWIKDGGIFPTVSTVAEIGLPLTEQAERGTAGNLTLVISKFVGPGTVYLNLVGGAVVGNADRELRAATYAERLGYQWNLDGEHLALIFGLVHEESDERGGEAATTAEIAFKYVTDSDIAIGPGLFFGIDGRDSTPAFGAGLTITF